MVRGGSCVREEEVREDGKGRKKQGKKRCKGGRDKGRRGKDRFLCQRSGLDVKT